MSIEKNNKQNLGKQRALFFTVGLVFGLSFLLVAFEWKTFTEAIKEVIGPVVQLGPIEEVAVVELTTPPPPTAAETRSQYAQQLADVPEFTSYGPVLNSSIKPQPLTESETEYPESVVKHTFKEHIVFQVCLLVCALFVRY